MFSDVDVTDENYVIFTLVDGTDVKIPTWRAFEELQLLVNSLNTNISSLQLAVNALENNDYVSSVLPLSENGVVIGYTITFSKSGTIVIYHGRDGKDGEDGEDGEDGLHGKDGNDGTAPSVGVRKDADGCYYWTLDGEWLLDESGNKIATTGKDGSDGADGAPGQDGSDGSDGEDGVTPKLKIQDDYWYVSYDNGTTWVKLYKAVGEDGQDGANGAPGKDGDAFFQSVGTDENELRMVLSDGTVITIPLVSADFFSRVKSVVHVPGYEGEKSAFCASNDEEKGYAQIDFVVAPAKVLAELDLRWRDILKFRVVETKTKAVNFIDLEILDYESDSKNGTFTLTVSGKKLPDEFYSGRKSCSAFLLISDGENEISTSFFDLIAVENVGSTDEGLSEPCITWGVDADEVKQYMSGFRLDYSDKTTLIYDGAKAEQIITYEFEDDRLCASAMFVEKDKVTLEEVHAFFDGYEVLHEYDGTYAEFMDPVSNTYAEVSIADKSGVIYYFIGWSEYVVDTGGNTITYLSSNNKAIPVSTLDGFGASLVANQFDKNTNIGTLVFDAPVTSIPSMAFSGASTLKSIDLPDGVRKIGKNAFASTGLVSIRIPKSVESIDSDAFAGCASLSRVLASDIASWCNIIFGNTYSNPLNSAGELYIDEMLVTDLVIPDGLTFIGDYAFYGAKCLETVTVPETLATIGASSFQNCSSLNRINISDLSAWCKISFAGSTSNPLYYAKNLYQNGILLKDLVIPDDILEIESNSFVNCSSITRLVIHKDVLSIGASAFSGCKSLSEVYQWGINPPTLGANAFTNILSSAHIYVPHVAQKQYKTNWSAYSSKIYEMPFNASECTSLYITAENVKGNLTSTAIHYEATVNGYVNDTYITDYVLTGTVTSEEFPQNKSTTETLQIVLSYTYMDKTATTTISHMPWQRSVVVSGGAWTQSTDVYMDSIPYYHYYKGNTNGTMTVEIDGFYEFSLYIRSFSNVYNGDDCVKVGNLDKEIYAYSTSDVKADSFGTKDTYKKVTFDNIDGGKHKITIVYRGDTSSLFSGAGHVLIMKP